MRYTLTFATDSAEELTAAARALPWAVSGVNAAQAAPTPPAPFETKDVDTPVDAEVKKVKVAKVKKVKTEGVEPPPQSQPEPEPETLEEPEAFSADEVKKALTRADVSKAYIALSAAKGKDFALGVLAKLDVTGIKELDESQFEEAIAQAQEALKEGV
jgi:hypothetical protein